MNDVSGDSQRRHSLSDWLALHELDPVTCRRILDNIARDAAEKPATDRGPDSGYQPSDLEVDWLRTAEAMRDFLPGHRNIVDDTFENTVKTVVDRPNRSRKALTLDNGPTAYPTILYTYYGQPPDSLIVAHEFGHAVQIRASRGKFVPPIMREVCAFLSEGALLAHALRRDETQYASLSQAWGADNYKYFGRQRDRLAADLLQPTTPYKYLWNYPIARYLAIRISVHFSRDRIWSIFEGETSVRRVLCELDQFPN
jgi:hypothetical protein